MKGGVLVGTYAVRYSTDRGLSHYRGTFGQRGRGLFGVGSKGAASKRFLPAKHNRESELRAKIIADRNAETHDFALTNSK